LVVAVVIFRKISFASFWCLFVTGKPGEGVFVANRGNPSEVLATCVNRGGIVLKLQMSLDILLSAAEKIADPRPSD
jgi:hypothetical protein